MRRKSPIQLEVNHDRWLVSYSDFVTLLFAFFVVMYSISQVNEGKYRVLSSTLMEAFSVPQSAIAPIQVGSPTMSTSPSAIDIEKPQSTIQNNPDQSSQPQQVEQTQTDNLADLSELANEFSEQFADLMKDELLRINSNELWLELELKDSILFPIASADPSLQAKGIFEEVAQMLAKFDNPVQVEGFTDNIPISNRRFSSNWELSAARSASVVKVLANNGVAPERLAAVGYGEFQPIASNDSAEGRAKNRRVVLMIAKDRSQRPRLQDEAAVQDAIGSDAVNNSDPQAIPTTENQNSSGADSIDEPLSSESEIGNDQLSNDQPRIDPIRLRDGGLLFTTDPNLQRQDVQRDDAPSNAAESNEAQPQTDSENRDNTTTQPIN